MNAIYIIALSLALSPAPKVKYLDIPTAQKGKMKTALSNFERFVKLREEIAEQGGDYSDKAVTQALEKKLEEEKKQMAEKLREWQLKLKKLKEKEQIKKAPWILGCVASLR